MHVHVFCHDQEQQRAHREEVPPTGKTDATIIANDGLRRKSKEMDILRETAPELTKDVSKGR